MNERFQQLLKQSTNPPWDGELGPANEFNLEKCFESIVRECMRMCDIAAVNYDIYEHTKESDGAIAAKELIAGHFGIDE